MPSVPLLIVGLVASGFVVWVALTSGRYSDFVLPYESALALHEGRDLYFSPVSRPGWRNMNPPHFVVLMAPLAWLSVRDALIVWWITMAMTMAGCIRLWNRVLPPGWALAVFALAFASAGGYLNVRYANQSWLTAFCVTWAWIAWRSKHYRRAAAVLGIVASIKLFVLILLPYMMWRRRWAAVGAFLGAAVGAVIVGVAICGPQSYESWVRALQEQTWQGQPLNMSILGGITRALDTRFYNLEPIVVVRDLILPAWLIGSALLTFVVWQRLRGEDEADRDFAALLLLMLLITPAGWIYYAPIAAGPVAAALSTTKSSIYRTAGTIALLMPYPLVSLGQPSAFATLTLASAYMWGGLFMLWATLHERPQSVPAR